MPEDAAVETVEPVAEEEKKEEVVEEVLPPEEEKVEEPEKAEEEVEEEEEDSEPSASELQERLDALEAENEQLKKGSKEEPVKTGSGASSIQTFVQNTVPKAREKYTSSEDSGDQFDVMLESTNQMLGAVMTDQINPNFQNLAISNIELSNSVDILTLKDGDAEFAALIPQIREILDKTDWKARSEVGVVEKIYHQVRGSKSKKTKSSKGPSPKARTALKDLSSGGGASPKPKGVRLSDAQEKDWQEMNDEGIKITRTEYYAKYKGRVDQAKANNKPIPKIYRSY